MRKSDRKDGLIYHVHKALCIGVSLIRSIQSYRQINTTNGGLARFGLLDIFHIILFHMLMFCCSGEALIMQISVHNNIKCVQKLNAMNYDTRNFYYTALKWFSYTK